LFGIASFTLLAQPEFWW